MRRCHVSACCLLPTLLRQPVPEFVSKVLQVFDCKAARHGNMLVGKTGSGKSTAWRCLQRTLSHLAAQQQEQQPPLDERFQPVQVHVINPVALSTDELYGCYAGAGHEWRDGVLAALMRAACKDEGAVQQWLLLDGPVDPLWIESMNSVLDDNKLLTLLSGAGGRWRWRACACMHGCMKACALAGSSKQPSATQLLTPAARPPC